MGRGQSTDRYILLVLYNKRNFSLIFGVIVDGVHAVRPHCQPGQQTAYGASRNEAVTVRCAVDAHPATDLSFRWMFNSTLAVAEVPNGSISTSGWQSNVTHRVYQNEQEDYGTLLCWARNAIGEQRDPCVFSIQPAGLFVF